MPRRAEKNDNYEQINQLREELQFVVWSNVALAGYKRAVSLTTTPYVQMCCYARRCAIDTRRNNNVYAALRYVENVRRALVGEECIRVMVRRQRKETAVGQAR